MALILPEWKKTYEAPLQHSCHRNSFWPKKKPLELLHWLPSSVFVVFSMNIRWHKAILKDKRKWIWRGDCVMAGLLIRSLHNMYPYNWKVHASSCLLKADSQCRSVLFSKHPILSSNWQHLSSAHFRERGRGGGPTRSQFRGMGHT